MSITKAVFLTLLIAFIEAGVQILFIIGFSIDANPNATVHAWGSGKIAAKIIAYSSIFFFFWKPKFKRDFQGKEFNVSIIPFLFFLLLGLEFVTRPFLDAENLILSFDGLAPERDDIFPGFTPWQVYSSISALVLAPIIEELFFRKFLLGKLFLKYSKTAALIISSLLFSAIHWETPANLIPAFLFGLISGILFLKTGKIRYSILLHFLYNLWVLFVAVYSEQYYEWLTWLGSGVLYWGLFVSGIGITVFTLKIIPQNEKYHKFAIKP